MLDTAFSVFNSQALDEDERRRDQEKTKNVAVAIGNALSTPATGNPLYTNVLQGCHSTGAGLVATAAQSQLPVPIVTPDVDLPSVTTATECIGPRAVFTTTLFCKQPVPLRGIEGSPDELWIQILPAQSYYSPRHTPHHQMLGPKNGDKFTENE
ncbi:hypothetical protein H920_04969 [Fukomys damarensis]|uniref:Uncharacterized protein n=1 Tax=Fukomys damarensis TaxID=885580 RepID=A0A091DT17_FUKDA|nr:hypothetical protein H920_04969 [Fukomys damarensis]